MSRRAAAEGRFGGGTLDDVGRHLPVRRIGIPDDIAAACAYLVSDEAGYVTGQIIGVNGGACHLIATGEEHDMDQAR